MPVNYAQYPQNWKKQIRPDILKRANNKCEQCKVPNYKQILRGIINGKEVYQDDDGEIFDSNTSENIGANYVGEVDETGKCKFIRVVLTVAHLDHNIENNDYSKRLSFLYSF